MRLGLSLPEERRVYRKIMFRGVTAPEAPRVSKIQAKDIDSTSESSFVKRNETLKRSAPHLSVIEALFYMLVSKLSLHMPHNRVSKAVLACFYAAGVPSFINVFPINNYSKIIPPKACG